MPNLELTDEEQAALLRLVKKAIDTDRYPLSPRLYPLRSILEKLEPSGPTLAPGRRTAQLSRRRHSAQAVF
jgi:hypothetical protein